MLRCSFDLLTWGIVQYLVRCSNPASGPAPSYSEGLAWVLAVVLNILTSTISRVHSKNATGLIGGEIRSLLAVAMSRKTLLISPAALRGNPRQQKRTWMKCAKDLLKRCTDRNYIQKDEPLMVDYQPWTSGAITQLLSADGDRIQDAVETVNNAWAPLITLPIQLTIG